MPEHSMGHAISGIPYSVTSANGRPPTCFDDFVGQAVVEVSIEAGREALAICGSCRVDGESLILYEKTGDGTGKDVRTWQISMQNGQFEAIARSMF